MNEKIREAFIDELRKIAAKTAFGLKLPPGIKLPSTKPGVSRTPIAESVAKKWAPKTKRVITMPKTPTSPAGYMKVRQPQRPSIFKR